MKRSRIDERKVENYRTVTEITDAENLYKKNFDVTQLTNKNEAYLRREEKREMYIDLSQYIAMILSLNIPDFKTVFGSNSQPTNVYCVVFNSLAFVNYQVTKSTMFVNMKFSIIQDRKMAIPGEPIVFYRDRNEDNDQSIKCYVDRAGILRVLEKPIDVNLVFEDGKGEVISRLMDRLQQIEQRNCNNPYSSFVSNEFMCKLNEASFKMDENYFTQFVTMLIIFTNAYISYLKLARTDFQQYFNFLTNHESLVQDNYVPNMSNLFTSKFNFTVEGEHEKKTNAGLIFKKF